MRGELGRGRGAHAVQPVSVLQTEYSLFERDVEQLFPLLDELGIGFVAYSPLGCGFITGTAKPVDQYDATDMRTFDPRWQPGDFERNVAAIERLADLAAGPHLGLTPLHAIPDRRRERVHDVAGPAAVR